MYNRFLQHRNDYVHCLSLTTRAPRGTEKDGVDYFFVSEQQFKDKIAHNALLEHACVFGKNFYGTSREFVETNLASGRGVIKVVQFFACTIHIV